jgi:radical SAM superfamily enzyme YgiQ (UPF0313 family)
MKILFLVAKLHTIEPFGIMSLSPHLKRHGDTVALFEAESPDLVESVKKFRPDVIGYSVCTGAERYYLSLNRCLKGQTRFIAVFGGPHPTFFPAVILEPGVDAICRGEGDVAFPEFLDRLAATGRPEPVPNFSVKREGAVESLPPRPLVSNLDSLPWPDRDLYYGVSPEIRNHRVRSFLAARGCQFSCAYCFNEAMDALYDGAWKRVRLRAPDKLVDEIVAVAGAYETDFVAFRESIFPLRSDWLRDFAARYPARVGLPFYCHLRLDLLNKENVSLLAKAGCHSVNVGIETGNAGLRQRLLGRSMSNQTIMTACAMLRGHGIRILANNMLGLPGATFEDDLETLRLNQSCKPDYALAMLWQPYPGTALAQYAADNGHYEPGQESLDFTYYNRSPLRFRNAAEKRRIENLQKLFAVAAALPWLTPVVKGLTRLKPNRVFKAIFRTVYLVLHQTEIFPHRMTAIDWLRKFWHITKET